MNSKPWLGLNDHTACGQPPQPVRRTDFADHDCRGQQSKSYEPFGNTTTTGSSTNSYQYTGRENDGTGLYFYRNRYYSPTLQRFVSEDPIGLKGGDVNFYSYAHQNPVSLTDPFGLWTFSLGGAFNVNYGFGSFQYSGGFVVDSSGDIGVYNTVGGAGAFSYGGLGNFPNPTNGYPFNNISPSGSGLNGSLGLSFGFSNAKYICDLGGPFVSASAGLGEGAAASADAFAGSSAHGTVVGGGVTAGLGLGDAGSVGGTTTRITPLAGRKANACSQ